LPYLILDFRLVEMSCNLMRIPFLGVGQMLQQHQKSGVLKITDHE
jgi:hypothetical protein